MDERLRVLAAAQGGAFSVFDAAFVGVPRAHLAWLARRGELVRVRRSAYVLAERWDAVAHESRHALLARAVLRDRRGDAASHHSALAFHGLPLHGCPLDIVAVMTSVSKVRLEAGVRMYPPATAAREVVMGVPCVPLPLALAQVCGREGVLAGVVAMDAAFGAGMTSPEQVTLAAEALADERVAARVANALARVDAASESAGESLLRMLLRDLGYRVRTQVVINAGGRFLGRVDALVDDCVVVEFDGRVKYEGHSGAAALMAEKARESRLAEALYEVVRVVWSELADPAELARRIRKSRHLALSRRQAAGWVPILAGDR